MKKVIIWLLSSLVIAPKNPFLNIKWLKYQSKCLLVSCGCYFYNCVHLFAGVQWPGIWNSLEWAHLFSCVPLLSGDNPAGYFRSLPGVSASHQPQANNAGTQRWKEAALGFISWRDQSLRSERPFISSQMRAFGDLGPTKCILGAL